jgi:hypothetical protein
MGSERLRDLVKEVARLLGAATAGGRSLVLELDALQKRTRKQLLTAAKKLELTGVSKLRKEQLAERVLEALKACSRKEPSSGEPKAGGVARTMQPGEPSVSGRSTAEATHTSGEAASPHPEDGAGATPSPPQGAATPAAGQESAATAKLDLGPAARDEQPVEHIPWSYGMDRVTAAAVDPDSLHVYWEVTDPAIERARAGLGPGGPGAWLSLRVYDTTGLIFDGTNAHSYFDHRIGRSDRQWFFAVNKPSSTAFVEIGMKSAEGFFVKVARSGRVDFPRKEPVPWSEPEWMAVLATAGQPQPAGTGVPSRRAGGPPAPRADFGQEPPAAFTPIPLWVLHESAASHEARARELLSGGWERVEWHEAAGAGWFELESHVEWEGPLAVTTWEAGPFAYPVEISQPLRQEWQGRSVAYRNGDVTHLIHGPWQVAIRNLGAHYGRSVVGRWEVYRSWVAESGRELRVVARPGQASALQAGASELVAAGASERVWLGASELRLGGASEVWRMGASELLFRGASERLFAGASQWMIGGASERLWLGMSETLLRGASERLLGGASERHLGASEQRFEGGSATPLPYPSPPDAYLDLEK